ncbi:MAG: leucine-rich repeat protein [Clostridia bacterium]|nr:leucine-rich repeat protein [Clostridia bacterium]
MDSFLYQCAGCGGELKDVSPTECECMYCGKKYRRQTVDDYGKRVMEALGKSKAEKVAQVRRELWTEIHAERPNGKNISDLSRQLKGYIPDDYLALFCDAVTSGGRKLNDFLISSEAEGAAEYGDVTLPFLFRTMQADNINAAGVYLERLVSSDPKKFGGYSELYEKSCEKLKSGLYEIAIPRDVFLAYSGEDMSEVVELCDYLESHGVTCFLALRNLRHGARAADDYRKTLESAMDNCRVFVFVSSVNSRNLACEALTYELPYVKSKDLESAPALYKHAYEHLPLEYKMPRVEYLLDSYNGDVAETISKEFFAGVEWCTTKEAVGRRVVKYLTTAPSAKKSEEAPSQAKKVETKPAPQKDEFQIKDGTLIKYNGSDAAVTVPSGVTSIGSRAFYGNPFLTTVIMPNSVTVIGYEAFAGCTRLISVKMPKNLMCIDGRAFADCVSLAEIGIPASVADMGKGVFSGDASMRCIYFGAASKPRAWNNMWCQCHTNMVWGVKI